MKLSMLFIAVTSLWLLSGCVEDLTADDTSAYQYLARGNSAQSDDKIIQVISSQASFDDVFYQVLNRSGTPETINFAEYQVLLVMSGSQQPAKALAVGAFQGQATQVNIVLKAEYAGENCAVPTVVLQPWMLVLFPRVDKPLSIQEQVKVTPC
ncbi:hypothetical protein [Rheinheimera baltica]|uniref:hypothetical protein n=1 Tax=Rheinheimera baltica TaxID=67576 RepID=UPI000422C905|nr:hypothetical protein [Rheinheimera baltica]MDP5142428.1 hypothetical protein [Rheinheimera baltica]MDP5150669.1 hypothetical protein [Rheinheimera baltica]MDP5191234.1 hypothetical protein [Rheinheimera baltica]